MRRIPFCAPMLAAFVLLGTGGPVASGDELGDLLGKVATWDYGQPAEALEKVRELALKAQLDAKQRADLSTRLAGLLDGKSTPAAKLFVCKQLYLIGTKEAVPALGRMLAKEETADVARYALERMDDPAAGKALRDALDGAKGNVRVGIVNSLGQRRDEQAIDALAPMVTASNVAISEAAQLALGKIGGERASAILMQAKAKLGPEPAAALNEALLMCADGLASGGKTKQAEGIYRSLYGLKKPPQTRAAALKGLIGIRKGDLVSLVLGAMARDDFIVAAAAADAVREVAPAGSTEALAKALPTMKPEAQVVMLHALADRGDAKALPAATAAADGDDPTVRAAALVAVGKLGDASSVMLLANAAATRSGTEAGAARTALDGLRGKGTDAAIIAALGKVDANVRKELIRSLAARGATSALSTLWTTAKDKDAGTRGETFKALGALGSEKDLAKLLDLLIKESNDAARRDAEAAAIAMAKRVPQPSNSASAVLAAFPKTKGNPGARAALVRILGQTGSYRLSASHGAESVKAAIDGDIKSRWSTGTPMKPGMWFQIDLGIPAKVAKIVLDATPSAGDYPRGYEIFVSDNPGTWGEPVAKGTGNKPVLEIAFTPKAGRYIRVVQTGSHEANFWSIHELKIETAE